RRTIAVELEPTGRGITRALLKAFRDLPAWEINLLHTKPLAFRPVIPRGVRARTHIRTVRRPEQRVAALSRTAIFVPAPGGEERLALEAGACGAAIVVPGDGDPERIASEVVRLTGDEPLRSRLAAKGRSAAERQSFEAVAAELD